MIGISNFNSLENSNLHLKSVFWMKVNEICKYDYWNINASNDDCHFSVNAVLSEYQPINYLKNFLFIAFLWS